MNRITDLFTPIPPDVPRLATVSAEPEQPAGRKGPDQHHPRPADWWPRPPLLLPPRVPPHSNRRQAFCRRVDAFCG